MLVEEACPLPVIVSLRKDDGSRLFLSSGILIKGEIIEFIEKNKTYP